MSKLRQVSNITDGPTAVGHEIDNLIPFTATGARPLSVKKANIETLAVSKEGVLLNSGFMTVVTPEEGWAGVRTALVAARDSGGGIVQLLEGTYTIDDFINLGDLTDGSVNVELRGMGEKTVIDHTAAVTSFGVLLLVSGNTVSSKFIDNPSVGDTTFVFSTITDAGLYKAGDSLLMFGTAPDGNQTGYLFTAASDGNPGTGELVVTTPLSEDITSATIAAVRGKNVTIRDMKFIDNGAHNNGCIAISGVNNVLLENLIFENYSDTGPNVSVQTSSNVIVRGCRFINMSGAFQNSFVYNSIIENNLLHNSGQNIDSNTGVLHFRSGCMDTVIRNNSIYSSDVDGITIGAVSISRRMSITDNYIQNCTLFSIHVLIACYDTIINNNIIEESPNAGIELTDSRNITVIGNMIRDCGQGVRTQGGRDITISGNSFFRINVNSAISIQVSGTGEHITVSNNVFRDCGSGNAAAILCQSPNCSISGNSIDGESNGDHGILLGSMANNCTLMGNTGRNLTQDGIDLGGASDCLVVGNNFEEDGIIVGAGTGNVFGLNKGI